MRMFIDCEFTDLPWTGNSVLLWVGLCDETGRTFSAVNADTDTTQASAFVQQHVLAHIPTGEPRLPWQQLADQVRGFCAGVSEFWAWQPTAENLQGYGLTPAQAADAHHQYADWDLQLLQDLTGATDPVWQYCHDLHALADRTGVDLPVNPQPHHPGSDAAWGRAVYQAATGRLS